MAVELQVCKNDLQNTRLLATGVQPDRRDHRGHAGEPGGAPAALAAMQAPAAQQVKANSVFTVRFDFGSTRVAIPPDVTAALVEDAKNSPLVPLRGRTDGTTDALAEPHRPRAGGGGA